MEDEVFLCLWVLGREPCWGWQGSISFLHWWDGKSLSRGYV